ncbi:MAG: phosphoglycerate dehydrogenase, partial [Hymenobacter sp.]
MNLCLIIDEMHASLLPMLRSIGVEGDYQPKLAVADVPAALAAKPYTGLMVRSKMRITAALLAHGPQLR